MQGIDVKISTLKNRQVGGIRQILPTNADGQPSAEEIAMMYNRPMVLAYA